MSDEKVESVVPSVEQEVFDLDRWICSLLTSEPFFAEISRHVDKRATTSIRTAGVRMNDDGFFEMLYNPDFFVKLTPKQRLGVLKHEFYHLLFGHVTDRLPDGKMSKKWNIATDLAINSWLRDELPDFCLFPGEGQFKNLPTKKAAEWYMAKLPQDAGEGGKCNGNCQKSDGQGEQGEGECNCPGNDSFDDHSGWQDGAKQDSSVKDLAKERLREAMKAAADAAGKSSNGWGSIPQQMRQDILDRISGKVDWRSVLRYFVKTSQRSSKTATVKRVNKRYAYIHPGVKVQRHAKIAVSIDQSGSVSDEMLTAFFSELSSLAKIATFTVVPFDTEVDEKLIYEWKKGMKYKKARVMCGGTDFNAPTKYVNGENFDGHIVLTDLQAPKPVKSRCQRMWMTTRDCLNHPYFTTTERVIAVD